MQVHKRASFGFIPPSSPSPLPRPGSVSGPSSTKMAGMNGEEGHKKPTESADATHVKVVVRIRPSAHNDASIPPRFLRTVLKPSSDAEVKLDVDPAMLMGHGTGGAASAGSKKAPSFSFDRVLPEDSTQVELYDAAAMSAVEEFMKGYNVTILAYGQTSSGKSYSMGTTGVETDYSNTDPTTTPTSSSSSPDHNSRIGIIPRAVSDIFERAEQVRRASGRGASFEAKLSFLELYNEDLIDLLGPVNGAQVQIREDREGRIIWSGLKEVKVKNTQEVMQYLKEGSARRRTGETGMNATSSRSHAIFSLSLVQRRKANLNASPVKSALPRPASSMGLPVSRSSTPSGARSQTPSSYTPVKSGLIRPVSLYAGRPSSPAVHSKDEGDDEWVVTTGKFNMVDLAGSERLKRTAAQGERMKEGIAINGGLLALGNVISALGDPAKAKTTTYIPYRDSKLTRLLQDSLGGNAYTVMIACVSPIEFNASETLSTLKYAARARNIKNSAKANQVEAGWDDVEHLQSTVVRLRKEMGMLKEAIVESGTSIKDLDAIKEENHGQTGRSSQRVAEIMRDHDKLNQQLLDKSGEVARLTSELQACRAGDFDVGSDFREAVGPIIAEYEKTVASFEARIQTLQSGLAASNEVRDEQEELLEELDNRQLQQDAYITELKVRVSRLSEREASHEGYIRDLESKLKIYAEKEDSTSEAVAELRREIAKHKEAERRASEYVAELEGRLSKSDAETSDLRARVETFETELRRRDVMYRDLEARMTLLDTPGETKQLLAELESKDKKVEDLERLLQNALPAHEHAGSEMDTLRELARQNEHHAQHRPDEAQEDTRPMSRPSLNTARTMSTMDVFHTPATEIFEQPLSLVTPPVVSSDLSAASPSTTSQIEFDEVPRKVVRKLEEQQAQTLAELDQVQARYRDALQEIKELAAQLKEAKLEQAELTDVQSSSPSLVVPDEEDDSASASPVASPRPSPRRQVVHRHTSTGSLYELGSRKDFHQGRGSSDTNRVRPQSLSQEFSSAALSPLSPSSSADSVRLLSPGSRNRASLPPSPRPQRSVQSLEQEVMSLQKALKDREVEIDHLEKSIKTTHGIPSRKNSANGPLSELHIPQYGVPLACTILLPPSPGSSPSKSNSSSPVATSRGRLAAHRRLPSLEEDDTLSQSEVDRLTELMSSMAQKETAHKQLTIKLQTMLDRSERKNEELQTSAKDQALNMSAELDSLRAQLASAGDDRATLAASAHAAAVDRQAEQHSAAHVRLQNAHETELATLREVSERHAQEAQDAVAALVALQAELKNLNDERQVRSDEAHAQHPSLLAVQARQVAEDSENRLRPLGQEHATVLAAAAEEHSRQLQTQRASHAREVQGLLHEEASIDAAHASAESERMTAQKALASAQAALQEQSSHVEAAELEFAESLQAVQLLEKELQDADAERGGLKKELSQLRFELSTSRDAHATLAQSSSKREGWISELERRLAESNGAREAAEAQLGAGVISPSAASRLSLARSTSPNGSQIEHPPPSAPPPSMPPPPVPTVSQSSCTPSRESTESTSAAADAKLAAQIEESDKIISTLNKQLSHCEADLQANIDMVNTLESALNDSERNLRKARMQSSDMARERDALANQAEQLRQQLRTAEQEVLSVRNSVQSERQGLEQRLKEEQLAKERARAQLEARVTAMQSKSSKFQCF